MADETRHEWINESRELYETESYEEANRYLKEGWILLTTRTKDYGDPRTRNEYTVYVLAWSWGRGNPVHPEQPIPEGFNIEKFDK